MAGRSGATSRGHRSRKAREETPFVPGRNAPVLLASNCARALAERSEEWLSERVSWMYYCAPGSVARSPVYVEPCRCRTERVVETRVTKSHRPTARLQTPRAHWGFEGVREGACQRGLNRVHTEHRATWECLGRPDGFVHSNGPKCEVLPGRYEATWGV